MEGKLLPSVVFPIAHIVTAACVPMCVFLAASGCFLKSDCKYFSVFPFMLLKDSSF